MKVLTIMICIALVCCAGIAGAEETRVGFVKNLRGQAFIERNKVKMAAAAEDKLLENDTLLTGSDGAMGVVLEDSSVLSIGSNSHLVISQYIFKPGDKKLSFLAQVKKGTMVYLTGLMGKVDYSGVKIESPTAVCGIRGTHFGIKVERRLDPIHILTGLWWSEVYDEKRDLEGSGR